MVEKDAVIPQAIAGCLGFWRGVVRGRLPGHVCVLMRLDPMVLKAFYNLEDSMILICSAPTASGEQGHGEREELRTALCSETLCHLPLP